MPDTPKTIEISTSRVAGRGYSTIRPHGAKEPGHRELRSGSLPSNFRVRRSRGNHSRKVRQAGSRQSPVDRAHRHLLAAWTEPIPTLKRDAHVKRLGAV
jgi:hypothetical protein